MALAAAYLLWETRGFTLFVDEWTFGFGARSGWAVSELLSPDNGHLAVVPIVITKVWLDVFGAASTLPLRLLAVGIHLTTALLLFVLLRRFVGTLAALPPAVLLLFLGSTFDVMVGSHALPIQIAIVTGLGAWLALEARKPGWDAVAALLLTIGVASNGFAFPFIAIAAAVVLLDDRSTWRRLWVPAMPLLIYVAWWLGYAAGGESDFRLSNIGGLPTFGFDSLGAELGALTGLFTNPGSFQQGFNLGPGEALAAAILVALLALVVGLRYRPPRAAIPPVVGLVVLWITTGMVAGGARQPQSIRYLYGGVILLLLIAAVLLAAAPPRVRRQGLWALAGICAISFFPNAREIRYGANFFRAQSNEDRVALAAADLLVGRAPEETVIETEASLAPGEVPDLGFSLGQYESSKRKFGTPAFSLPELEATDPGSRQAADRLIARALPIAAEPASAPPRPLSAGAVISSSGGSLRHRRGCFEFHPTVTGAQLTVQMPPPGLWVRTGGGPLLPIAVRRFAEAFTPLAPAIGGRASEIVLPSAPVGRGWQAQLSPQQAIAVCAAGA